MVYTEYDPTADAFIVVLFSATIIGIPLLFLFSYMDDSVARDHAEAHGDEIAGRCETCGDLVRSENAHVMYVEEVDRGVLLCPFGYREMGGGFTEPNRELAVEAIRSPMLMKRLAA